MTYYTNKEIDYIRENYDGFNLAQIASALGRHKTNVCRKARELGLTDKGRCGNHLIGNTIKKFEWTFDKTEYLKKNYDRKNYCELSKFIGCGDCTIRSKLKQLGLKKSEHKWHNGNHPRGMLGKHHSNEYREVCRLRAIKYWRSATQAELEQRYEKQIATRIKNGTLNPSKNSSTPYSRANGGKREDLCNQYFRSSWEANIARYLNFLGKKWEYEPREFIFEGVRRGCISYTPDFYIIDDDTWIEVKGWMDKKSATKLRRFKKYYPDQFSRLEIIGPERYREISKLRQVIKHWE